jgi:hypothetical protein
MISLIYNKISDSLSKYAILLIMALYLVIAVGSGLRGGIITGLVSLVLLYFAYRFGKQSYILLFYIFVYFLWFF